MSIAPEITGKEKNFGIQKGNTSITLE